MVNTYAVQSGGCRFESLWGFGFFLKGAHYKVDYSGKKNLLSWTAMHIDFVMCKNLQIGNAGYSYAVEVTLHSRLRYLQKTKVTGNTARPQASARVKITKFVSSTAKDEKPEN